MAPIDSDGMNPPPFASAPAGAGPITVGAVVAGRYRVTARLGAGGMATIYRAVDESLERDVAIKVLHPHLADDASLLARFRSEARAAAGLLHPHIVNVFDQGVADLPFIVMEFVDGPSLREVLLQRGRLTPGEALAVVEPICTALARAHAAGVVHRDIKPENVLIAADGTVKVADFGIARAIAETSHTATGTLVGSVHYLAPELMGGEEASARSDQYSLGVVLFELITGRKPLPAETPMAVAMRHARERIPSVRDFVSDAPAAVDGVIAKATATSPAKRYPDLAAMAAALRAAIPGGPEPVVVGADGTNYQTLVIAVDAEPTVTVPQRTGKRRPRRTRTATAGVLRPRSLRKTLLSLLVLLLVLGAGAFAAWNWVLRPVVPTPTLVGMSEDAALAAADEAGLLVEFNEPRHDLDVDAGKVLLQDPAPNEGVRRGDQVTLTLSLGADRVQVPAVVDKPAQRGIPQLEGPPYYLQVTTKRAFSDTVEKGRIIKQTPAGKKNVLQGSAVTVVVSKGIEPVQVPAVVGSDDDEAFATLDAAGLKYAVTEEYSDEVPTDGEVISQSVEPETTVDKGTTVQLVVSKGPITLVLDDYVGQGLEEARAALGALDLGVHVIEQARPMIGPERFGSYGRVEAQVPEAGSSIKRGKTVTLYTFSASAEAAEEDG